MLLKVTQNNKKLIANSTYPSYIQSSKPPHAVPNLFLYSVDAWLFHTEHPVGLSEP